MSQTTDADKAGPSPARNVPETSERSLLLQAVLAAGMLGLGLIILRTVLMGQAFPWADLMCFLVFAAVIVLANVRPGRERALSWIAFAALVGNVADAHEGFEEAAVAPYYILLPALVALGALMGDALLTAAGLVVVLGMYGASAAIHAPLSGVETAQLANLSILTIAIGAAGFVVCHQQNRLRRELELRAEALRRELELNTRLLSVVTHDISNPLTVLGGCAELVRAAPTSDPRLDTILDMTGRIAGIVEAVRGLQTAKDGVVPRETVPVEGLADDVRRLFEQRLKEKGQNLRLVEGGHHRVQAHASMLCHSVVGNFVGNAIKFSDRGAVIEIGARREGVAEVRIEVRDRGRGMDETAMAQWLRGDAPASQIGTEGEIGSGLGLRIAALCAQRCGGRVELSMRTGGGTIAAVVLPAAMEHDLAQEHAMVGATEANQTPESGMQRRP